LPQVLRTPGSAECLPDWLASTALRIPHIPGLPDAPTATIAWIGDPTKPCVALRADIDALPITEHTGLPYASQHPGRMHACGHDGHTASLLGAAAILKEIENELDVCVKLLWQPAEEGGGGAQRLINAGVLDGRLGPKVTAIFGLHGWPGLKVGAVATKAGPFMAAVDNFSVTFLGKGCHGAYPHLGHDPIVAACEAVTTLQAVVSRDLDPTEPAVLTVGIIQGGTAVNVIPDRATFSGTVRTLNDPVRKQVCQALERRCRGIATAHGCQFEFQWLEGYPPVLNHPGMTDYVALIARAALGESQFLPVTRASMGGEDFAYYLEKVPGCFFMVGVEPADCKEYPSLHSDHYNFTDDALPVAIRMFTSLVLNYGVDWTDEKLI
jgi:amidohydrolase